MPAHDTEIQEALSEGVEILCLRSIGMIDGNSVLLNKMNYDEENNILTQLGESEVLTADFTIFAIGQSVDTGVLNGMDDVKVSEKGIVEVDSNMMTGVAGIFAGGDVVQGKRTVTHAIGHGKKAAKCIDAYLRGVELPKKKKAETAIFRQLNTAYFEKNPRVNVPILGKMSFEELDISIPEKEIIAEADRCFSCGNCFHCDICYGYCPDNAIRKGEDGSLEIDYDYCKGCGICASECPCGAIKMTSKK
jgi:2-oxoacid:acceptor oxidoreductase delta subunit (pyruvate/2-ketoisovalerate family)